MSEPEIVWEWRTATVRYRVNALGEVHNSVSDSPEREGLSLTPIRWRPMRNPPAHVREIAKLALRVRELEAELENRGPALLNVEIRRESERILRDRRRVHAELTEAEEEP